MLDKSLSNGPPLTRKKYTLVFKTEYVRQVVAGVRQTDVALYASQFASLEEDRLEVPYYLDIYLTSTATTLS